MAKIFISYRRDDSFGYAQTIYRELVQHFSKAQVFMDVDTIEPGVDFVRVIEAAVGECDVLLAVIGKRWGRVRRGTKSRLDDPNDFVRLEISAALARDIRVIPVLVDGMRMPAEDVLPTSLKALTRRNAMEISHTRFNYDLEQLITVIRKVLDASAAQPNAKVEAQRRIEEERSRAHQSEQQRLQAEALRQAERERLEELERRRVQKEAARKAEEEKERNRAQREAEQRRMEAAQRKLEEERLREEARAGEQRLIANLDRVARKAEEERLREQERQRAEKESRWKPGTVFRDRLKDGSEGPEMVVLPPGTFMMGDDVPRLSIFGKHSPVHQVIIRKPFAMSRYEVTFEEYDQFAKVTLPEMPGDEGWGRGRLPVINVSWNDAVAYTKWLSEQTGKRYRLPSEAEWEYAARAGTETWYWWGDGTKSGMAHYSRSRTALVGSFKPNPFGLYDTAGNVWEWVQDCWHKDYNGAPTDGSAWERENGGDCSERVCRGGSWRHLARVMRASYRFSSNSDKRNNDHGFRLAQDLD